jgi:hypothetical protein
MPTDAPDHGQQIEDPRSRSTPPKLGCSGSDCHPISPKLRWRDVTNDEVVMRHDEAIGHFGHWGQKPVGNLDHRPSCRDASQQILKQGDAPLHRETEQRHRTYDTVELLVGPRTKDFSQSKRVSQSKIDAWKALRQAVIKILRISTDTN